MPDAGTANLRRGALIAIAPEVACLASTGESAANLGNVGLQAIYERTAVEGRDGSTLIDYLLEEFTHEVGHRKTLFGGQLVESRSEVAGETHRQVTVLARRGFGCVFDLLAGLVIEPPDALRLGRHSPPLFRSSAA